MVNSESNTLSVLTYITAVRRLVIDQRFSADDAAQPPGSPSSVSRNTQFTGGLESLRGAHAVVLSPDQGELYVAGSADDEVAVFRRDIFSGLLTPGGTQRFSTPAERDDFIERLHGLADWRSPNARDRLTVNQALVASRPCEVELLGDDLVKIDGRPATADDGCESALAIWTSEDGKVTSDCIDRCVTTCLESPKPGVDSLVHHVTCLERCGGQCDGCGPGERCERREAQYCCFPARLPAARPE